MRLLSRFLATTVALALGLCLLAPWLGYEIALLRLQALPVRPQQLASPEQQDEVWRRAGGEGPLTVQPLNPYGFVIALMARERVHPAEELASWVARQHMLALPREGAMTGWQVSNAALTIWLTRNWSAQELASAAYALSGGERSGRRP